MSKEAVVEVEVEEARELLLNNRGHFFGATFIRKQPKCQGCGKRFKAEKVEGVSVCPKCGGELSFVRKTAGLLGVKKPTSGATVPGQGQYKGESFEEALAKGRVKYYDPNVVQKDGKGDYRQFCLDLVIDLVIDHVRYKLV